MHTENAREFFHRVFCIFESKLRRYEDRRAHTKTSPLRLMAARDVASSLPPSTVAPDDGPTLQELVARECAVLEAIGGVTSVKRYERQRREALNKSMLKVRLRGRKDPLTVHCKVNVPNLLVAAQLMMEKVAAELGAEAVAEGRRRFDAQREAAAAPAAASASEPSQAWPGGLNLFEHCTSRCRLRSSRSSG